MARKTARPRPSARVPAATTTKSETAKTDSAKPAPISSEQQFQMDYAYVIKDLRRIFILAGIMFALLIILNLVLR